MNKKTKHDAREGPPAPPTLATAWYANKMVTTAMFSISHTQPRWSAQHAFNQNGYN